MRHPDADHNPNTPELMNKAVREEAHVQRLNYGDWDRFARLLKNYNGGTLLDAGCLNSPICVEMKAKYPESEVYALDHADEVIAYYQARYPQVHYICANCYELPFENETFDYIVAGEILEHLDSPEKLIEEAYRVLKPGGWFALSTPFEEFSRSQGGKLHVNTFTFEETKELLKDFREREQQLYHVETLRMILAWAKK